MDDERDVIAEALNWFEVAIQQSDKNAAAVGEQGHRRTSSPRSLLDRWDSPEAAPPPVADWFAERAPPAPSDPLPHDSFRRHLQPVSDKTAKFLQTPVPPTASAEDPGGGGRACPVCGLGFAKKTRMKVHMMCALADRETAPAGEDSSSPLGPAAARSVEGARARARSPASAEGAPGGSGGGLDADPLDIWGGASLRHGSAPGSPAGTFRRKPLTPNTPRLRPLDGTATLGKSGEGAPEGMSALRGGTTRRSLSQLQKQAREEGAAVAIQRTWRGWVVRRDNARTFAAARQDVAATWIQTAFRGHLTRRLSRAATPPAAPAAAHPEDAKPQEDSSAGTNNPQNGAFIQTQMRATLHRKFMEQVLPSLASKGSLSRASSGVATSPTEESSGQTVNGDRAPSDAISSSYAYSSLSDSRPMPSKQTTTASTTAPTPAAAAPPPVATSYAYSNLSDSRPIPFAQRNAPREERAQPEAAPKPAPSRPSPAANGGPQRPGPGAYPSPPPPTPPRTGPGPYPSPPPPRGAPPEKSSGEFTCEKCGQQFEFKLRLSLHWCTGPARGRQPGARWAPGQRWRSGEGGAGPKPSVGGEAFLRRQAEKQREQEQRKREAERERAEAARRQREDRDRRRADRERQDRQQERQHAPRAAGPPNRGPHPQAGVREEMVWEWYLNGAESALSSTLRSRAGAGQGEAQIREVVLKLIERHTSKGMSKGDLLRALGVAVEGEGEKALKLGYRKAAMRFHPDKNRGAPPHQRVFAEEVFKVISLRFDGIQ